MTNGQAIETLKDMKSYFNDRSHKQYSMPAIDLAIQALEKQKVFEDLHMSIEEVVARNLIAWETSKDKREGLLPEVYLINKVLFKQLTGLEPTMPNLRRAGKLDWSVEE